MSKIIRLDNLVALALIVSPIAYMAGRTIEEFDIIVFSVVALVLTLTSVAKNSIRGNIVRALAPILIASLISLVMQDHNKLVLSACVSLAMFVLVSQAMQQYKIDNGILFIPLLINVAVLIAQMMHYSPIVKNIIEPGGIMGNAPRLAMYASIIMPLIFKRNKTVTTITMMFLGIVLHEAYVLLFIAFLWLFEYRHRFSRKTIIVFVVLASIFIASHVPHAMIPRSKIWLPTLSQTAQSPLFGYGVGIFPHVSSQFIRVERNPLSENPSEHYFYADNAFSSLLQFLFSTGLTGLIAIWLMLSKFSIQPVDEYKIALAFLLFLCIFEYPLEIPKLWIIIAYVISKSVCSPAQSGQDCGNPC